MPKYFIKTYGCQMNVNDSENLAGLLEYAGYDELKSLNTSKINRSIIGKLGIVIVNTCCVRQSAENKAYGFIASLGPVKKINKKLIVAVCGCIPKEPERNIKKQFPYVDIIFGPGEIAKLAEYLGVKGCATQVKRAKGPVAYVTIMEGCDNFCSYCIVPYVRGREKSRPVSDILSEIKGLDENYKEVVLLGQNVNSYKGPGIRDKGLGGLLYEVNDIDSVKRIRFLTSHPKDMSDEIINAVKVLPKVCEFFHLPLQSGDDAILKAMNRPYTSGDYKEIVNKIKWAIPDATVTSDAIVGFPGETEEQFLNTCDLIEELELDAVNTLSYSVRPGTAAAKLKGHIPEKEKKQRLQHLMSVVGKTVLRRNVQLKDKTMEILVDVKGMGRTRGNKPVKFNDKASTGDIIKVKIDKAGSWVLEGHLVS